MHTKRSHFHARSASFSLIARLVSHPSQGLARPLAAPAANLDRQLTVLLAFPMYTRDDVVRIYTARLQGSCKESLYSLRGPWQYPHGHDAGTRTRISWRLRCCCRFAALALVSRYTNCDWLHVFAKGKIACMSWRPACYSTSCSSFLRYLGNQLVRVTQKKFSF